MKNYTIKTHVRRWYQLGLLFLLLASTNLLSQNVVVSGASVGSGSYPTLGAAFAAINGGSQTSASILINIVGNTSESATAVLNSGTWASVLIQPSGGASRSITGSIAGPLVDLNGVTSVTINGLNTGGNALTISNTDIGNLTTATVRFINDAFNNSINNTTLLGSGTSATLGTVLFSTGVTTGNTNNTVSNSTISAAGTNAPTNGIYGTGTSTATNNNNSILNNSISDFANSGFISTGINLASNNSNWTINNNKFFQTSIKTYTVANTHRAILIAGGNGYTINNNVIGYSANNATGSYAMAGTIAIRFVGIEVASGTLTPTSIQSNTVTAITLTTSSGATTGAGIICGISLTGGNNTVSNNLIGGTSGTNLIQANPTTAQGAVVGINCGSTGTLIVTTNIIGGLTSTGLTAAVSGGVAGINVSSAAASLNIVGNTIGNVTPDNMRAGTNGFTTGSSIVSGINMPATSTGTIVVVGNIIQNLSSFGTGTGGYVRGIWTAAASGNLNTYSITTNMITNLNSNTGLTSITSGQAAAVGINISTGTNGIVSNNTITAIALTNTTTTGNFAAGITCANATSSRILNNRIYNINNAGTSITSTAPNIAAGIIVRSGTTDVTIANNFISVGNGVSNSATYIGIQCNHGSTPDPINKIYFNTINIEGVCLSSQSSFGFIRGDFSTIARPQIVDFKNNLITNTRAGGTGFHYAIANNFGNAGTATGWGINASNNNVLNAQVSLSIGYWANANQTFSQWQTNSLSDANSASGIPITYINSANDLHLNMGVTPTFIESHAQVIAGLNTDIDLQSRPGPLGSVNGGGILPDIGADEIDAVFIDAEAPVITYTDLANVCSTANRTLTATITDLTGVPTTGLLRPRIYFNKNAGAFVSASGTLTVGTAVNGVWDFVISASALGGVTNGDVISYYVIAQDVKTPTFYIGSNPATGLVATNVNAVTTPPTITTQIYTVSLIPTITVNSGAICSGNSFTINPVGPATLAISGGTNIVSPTVTTSYTITGTDVNTCTNTAISNVTVNANPTITVNSGAICSGNNFTIVPSGAATYTYSSGSAIVNPTATASYSVVGANAQGCVSSNTAISTVTVNATPILTLNSGTICNGSSFTIVPSGANTYTFSSGSAIVSPTTTSNYTVIGSNTLGCNGSAITTVTVNALPTVNAVTSTTLICVGQSANLTASGAATYSWNTSATTSVIAVSPTVTTTYTVTGVGANGCSNVTTVIQNVSPCTGINNVAINPITSLLIYPNPNTGVFTISLNTEATVAIYNAIGKLVYTKSLSNGVHTLELNHLTKGIYFVKSNDNVYKMIVE
jgi:trimeric autotransporter adhesin